MRVLSNTGERPPGADLRAILRTSADEFYADVDVRLAGRIAAALFLLALAYSCLLWSAFPPTDAIGDAGWAVALGLTAGTGALIALSALGKLGPTALLLLSYVAAVAVGAGQWLSGQEAPFSALNLIIAVYAAAVHPPRRVLPLLGFLLAVGATPLVYDGWSWPNAAVLGARALLWLGLAAAAIAWTARVRMLRAEVRAERDRAADLARTDALTGLGNRHALDERLGDGPVGQVAVLLVDLEDFKEVNERHGHQAGDWLLASVADELRRAVRRVDACFRWGGDEFLVVIPGGTESVCAEVAHRVKQRIAACRRPDGRPLGIAIGEAEAEPGDTLHDLIARADKRLLLSKAAG